MNSQLNSNLPQNLIFNFSQILAKTRENRFTHKNCSLKVIQYTRGARKIMPCKKLIILGKKIEKVLASTKFELRTSKLKGQSANHYTIDPC